MSVQTGIQVLACQSTSATKPMIMSGTFTIGASGAVSAFDGNSIAGFTVAKTAAKTGRYDIVTHRKFKRLVVVGCVLEGPADAAFGNTDGNAVEVRNVSGSSAISANVQTILASSGADTNTTSGNKIHLTLMGFDA